MLLVFSKNMFSQTEYQTFTYPSGQISSEGILRDGKPDGIWKTYYENGQLKSIGKRTDFLLDSTWIFFKETGDTSLIINYRKDLKNGFVISKDRQDNECKIPIMTISISIISTTVAHLTHFAEISKRASELKKLAKKQNKSSYVFERRKYSR